MRGLRGYAFMPPDFDPDRRGRRLKTAAILGVGILTLGSCGGAMLGQYTVSGMSLFQADSYQPVQARRDEPSWIDDLPAPIDARAEARDAIPPLEIPAT